MKRILMITGIVLFVICLLFMLLKPARIIETTKIQRVEIKDTKKIEELQRQITQLKKEKQDIEKSLARATEEIKNIKTKTEVAETYGPDGKLIAKNTRTETIDTSTKKTNEEAKEKESRTAETSTNENLTIKKKEEERIKSSEITEQKKITEYESFELLFGPAIYCRTDITNLTSTKYDLRNIGANLGLKSGGTIFNLYYLNVPGENGIFGISIMTRLLKY